MNCDKKNMLLYAVTDRAWTGSKSLYQQVELALKGGVTCVQLREKKLNDEDFLSEAIEIRKLCNKYKVPFIINDNAEIAMKSKADGVHVGQSDMIANNVRKLIGDNMILGVSAHNKEEAIEAVKNGADYLGVGAAFATSTKSDTSVLKRETIREICQSVSVPIVAIGGIGKANILELCESGVDGVALVSAIFSAENIEEECKELRILSQKMVNTKPCK